MGSVADLTSDQILTIIEDAFDAAVAPSSMVRKNGNKLHLIFKADAAGYALLNDAVLALKQRFIPALCAEGDLADVAAIAGTEYLPGKQSQLTVTVANTDTSAGHTLAAGSYALKNASGQVFTFSTAFDVTLGPSDSITFAAASADIGAFHVAALALAPFYSVSGAVIDGSLQFSVADNALLQGYLPETVLQFRQRLLSQRDRDDVVTEIENAINALPTIFDCVCLFNASVGSVDMGPYTLAPMELLVCINGTPSADIAKAVATRCAYITHEADPAQVEYYASDVYLGGQFPVYFVYFSILDYAATITFTYDSSKIQLATVESVITNLLAPMKNANTHADIITTKSFFDLLTDEKLAANGLLSVSVVGIGFTYEGGSLLSYVSVPKTSIGRYTPPLTFTPIDLSGA